MTESLIVRVILLKKSKYRESSPEWIPKCPFANFPRIILYLTSRISYITFWNISKQNLGWSSPWIKLFLHSSEYPSHYSLLYRKTPAITRRLFSSLEKYWNLIFISFSLPKENRYWKIFFRIRSACYSYLKGLWHSEVFLT